MKHFKGKWSTSLVGLKCSVCGKPFQVKEVTYRKTKYLTAWYFLVGPGNQPQKACCSEWCAEFEETHQERPPKAFDADMAQANVEFWKAHGRTPTSEEWAGYWFTGRLAPLPRAS